jgi:hypothetical protein
MTMKITVSLWRISGGTHKEWGGTLKRPGVEGEEGEEEGAGIRTPGRSGSVEFVPGIVGEVIGEGWGVVDVVLVVPEDGVLKQDP